MSVSEIPRPVIEDVQEPRFLTSIAPDPGPGPAPWERRYQRMVVALDLILVAAAAALAYMLRFGVSREGQLLHLAIAATLPIAWLAAMHVGRGYEFRFLYVGRNEYRRIVVVGGVLIALLAMVSYATKAEVSRGYLTLALVLGIGVDLAGRYLLRVHLHRSWRSGRNLHRTVIVGYERAVAGAVRLLGTDWRSGLRIVGACLPPHRPRPVRIEDVDLPVLGTFEEISAGVMATGADTVVVLPSPEMDGLALRRLAWELERTRTRLVVSPGLLDVAGPRATIRPMSGLSLLHVEHAELSGLRRRAKEVVDRALAAVALVLLAPVILAISTAIRLDSNGPALFRQVRVGKDGEEFVLFKFRTMCADAERIRDQLEHRNEGNAVLFKLRRDPRVTRVGRLLRRTSLDELPQLLNVLRGEMSLVGPRPPLPAEVDRYAEDVRRRLAVKPGITGLWQVSGRSDLSWDESVRLDLTYVENWTFWLDLVIMLKTVRAVAKGTGAY